MNGTTIKWQAEDSMVSLMGKIIRHPSIDDDDNAEEPRQPRVMSTVPVSGAWAGDMHDRSRYFSSLTGWRSVVFVIKRIHCHSYAAVARRND